MRAGGLAVVPGCNDVDAVAQDARVLRRLLSGSNFAIPVPVLFVVFFCCFRLQPNMYVDYIIIS